MYVQLQCVIKGIITYYLTDEQVRLSVTLLISWDQTRL